MTTVFIGQRGTGKSSLLARISSYLEGNPHVCYDLDYEIEKRENKKIIDIFALQGEEAFRALEKKYFQILLGEAEEKKISFNQNQLLTFIAVGGGFDVSLITKGIRVISLIRSSDSIGRIFLDRPSLNPELSYIEEFLSRYEKRKEKFQQKAWEEYVIPEGLRNVSLIENQILVSNPTHVGGILTLLPHYFNAENGFKFFIDRRVKWDIDYFEVRDDLLSVDQIKLVLKFVPKSKILLARRNIKHLSSSFFKELEVEVAWIDYDREFWTQKEKERPGSSQSFFPTALEQRHEGNQIKEGVVQQRLRSEEITLGSNNLEDMSNLILSVHFFKKDETLTGLLRHLEHEEAKGFHIKLAVEINSFAELEEGHRWQQQKPEQRSFLPRSSDGRWLWYRLYRYTSQKINFFREGAGSAPDQPSLYQWIQRKNNHEKFAALLGSPVTHSFTPLYHELFFQKRKINVFPIQVEIEEFSFALKILKKMGLVAAAVTSPLKLVAFQQCAHTTSVAQLYQSVNTLLLNSAGEWLGHNTDEDGMRALKATVLKIFFQLQNQNHPKSNQFVEKIGNQPDKLDSQKSLLGMDYLIEGSRGRGVLFVQNYSKENSQESEQLRSIENIAGERTDLLADIPVAVWGGGGTLPLLRKQFSQAEFFSAQTGLSRENNDLSQWTPEIVIWAGGRFQEEGTSLPPKNWRPQLVVDLNYREDSGGRELALKVGAKYLSGETMFYAQADAQQLFWQQHWQTDL